ncbi:MAG: hypothetical protein COV72_06015 [Candidatus Omnitrophica bacterium CG11_big_fil_rev_8_21_14_0_20_42_13]|uniref:DNA 3'-5' helicase n=1 Tax=Candidatus Ghiorseimicrobium undicola TaxID=1974746 RepID=A0A2H0LWP9_9BACT|nr:MAG: hypothetical protein COV72_06015 [Candidatus Omnitrophica bacterium CG11_big_fil_rev_8_21_14_0_20_42_13]
MKRDLINTNELPLNNAQKEAVTTLDGPVLVVAGAGTGKTRVIEYRVLNLVLNNVEPEKILLLTFTRKAARSMLERASTHNIKCKKVDGGTFHSFAYKVIQRYHKKLGFSKVFSFIDESDAEEALSLLASKLGFRDKKERFPKKDTLRAIISMSFNRSEKIFEVIEREYAQFLNIYRDIEELKDAYIKYKIERGLIDYDDMLLYLKIALEEETIRRDLSSKYRYIMVDEFQDTNKIQGEIVYLLSKEHENVLVVGDDTQSIYSFRGAYYKNMFNFPKQFRHTKIITLEENYRSTQPILDLANGIIEEEHQKYTKVLYAVRKGLDKPKLLFFRDAYDEASWVARRIKQLYDEGMSLNRIGVLYRSNHLSLPLQVELAKLNIPFIVYGGIRFIETAHVKDTLAFLRIAYNFRDDLSWHRVLSFFEGIGPVTAEKVLAQLLKSGNLNPDLEYFKKKKFYSDLKSLLDLIGVISSDKTVSNMVDEAVDFYYPFMKKKFDDYQRRADDLKVLSQIAEEYRDLSEFLADFVALEPPQRSMSEMGAKQANDELPVVLSTIHSAKGLEWENVFIIGLCDGSLPVSYALDDEEAIEEECRLLYVAVTRAKTNLYLSMHNESHNHGISTFNKLSRFLTPTSVFSKLDTDLSRLLPDADDNRDYNYDDNPDENCPSYTKSSFYRRLREY